MGMEEDSEKKESKHSIENAILDKVGLVISAIKDAKHVDSIACALHSLAVMLFPLDSSLFLGQFILDVSTVFVIQTQHTE